MSLAQLIWLKRDGTVIITFKKIKHYYTGMLCLPYMGMSSSLPVSVSSVLRVEVQNII